MVPDRWSPVAPPIVEERADGGVIEGLTHLLRGRDAALESSSGLVAAVFALDALRADDSVEFDEEPPGDEVAAVLGGDLARAGVADDLKALLRSVGLVAVPADVDAALPDPIADLGGMRIATRDGSTVEMAVFGSSPSLVSDLLSSGIELPVADEDLDARADWFQRRHGVD